MDLQVQAPKRVLFVRGDQDLLIATTYTGRLQERKLGQDRTFGSKVDSTQWPAGSPVILVDMGGVDDALAKDLLKRLSAAGHVVIGVMCRVDAFNTFWNSFCKAAGVAVNGPSFTWYPRDDWLYWFGAVNVLASPYQFDGETGILTIEEKRIAWETPPADARILAGLALAKWQAKGVILVATNELFVTPGSAEDVEPLCSALTEAGLSQAWTNFGYVRVPIQRTSDKAAILATLKQAAANFYATTCQAAGQV